MYSDPVLTMSHSCTQPNINEFLTLKYFSADHAIQQTKFHMTSCLINAGMLENTWRAFIR